MREKLNLYSGRGVAGVSKKQSLKIHPVHRTIHHASVRWYHQTFTLDVESSDTIYNSGNKAARRRGDNYMINNA